ncbi:MAG TPA: hypothetical protein VI653_28260 [Steroidobacteraceae bacterium]
MNALLLEPTPREVTRMWEDDQNQRLLGEMRSDIRHLQSDVTDIKADQRNRFDKIDACFDKVDQRFDKMDARFQKVDERFDQMDARFQKADERFDQMDARFQKVDERFDQMDARFQKADERIDDRFDKVGDRFGSLDKEIAGLKGSIASAKIWALGLYVALAGTMLGVMARGFKWI